jgi:hypothetical protein
MAVIKVKPWGKGQGDHVLIDDFLFDPAKHELYDAPQAEKGTEAETVESHEPKKRGRPAKGNE